MNTKATPKKPATKAKPAPKKKPKIPARVKKVLPEVEEFVERVTAGRKHPRTRTVQAQVRAEKEANGEKGRRPVSRPWLNAPWKPGESGNPDGRPPTRIGRINRLTAEERLKMAKEYGVTPLEFLLSVMADDENALMEERIDAAKAAAPYMHRKMPIGIEGPIPGTYPGLIDAVALSKLPASELDDALRVLAKMGLVSPAIAEQFLGK